MCFGSVRKLRETIMEKYEKIERSIIKTYRKNIWRKFIKGINEYKMLNEGDTVAVCLSGGMDSAVMAKCAQEIHRHGVVRFSLKFIHADTGLPQQRERTENMAKLLNIPFEIFEADGELTDCLVKKAMSLGCNKIALGNHFDDVVETILSNMLRGGKIATLMPKERREDGMGIVRPLYMVKAKDILAWARFNELEFDERTDGDAEIKELVRRFRKTSPYIDMNIFNSMMDVNLTTIISYNGKGGGYCFLDDYSERGQESV